MARRLRRATARIPGAGLTQVPARTALFAVRSLLYAQRQGRVVPEPANVGRPVVRPTAALVAQVALDEAILSVMMSPRRLPHRADYLRVEAEIMAAKELYGDRGWIADPAGFHQVPPPLAPAEVTVRPGRSMGLSYEQVAFTSGYEPHSLEPGRERWLEHEANRTAGAWVVRHGDDTGPDGRPRPWIVCIHGFGTGTPMMDIAAFRAGWMHRRLGVNLVFPTLPLHGLRRSRRISGDGFMSFDHLDSVHALAQSIWDIRRILSWVRAQGGEQLGVYGVSLGGYVAALLVGLDDGFSSAVAGIPPTDFPALFEHHSPKAIRGRAAATASSDRRSGRSTGWSHRWRFRRGRRGTADSSTPGWGTACRHRPRPTASGNIGSGPQWRGTPATMWVSVVRQGPPLRE